MNKALRFVWLSLLTLICGVASAGTVVFDPTVDTGGGKSITKNGITFEVLTAETDEYFNLNPRTNASGETYWQLRGRFGVKTDLASGGSPILSVTFEILDGTFINPVWGYNPLTYSSNSTDNRKIYLASDNTYGEAYNGEFIKWQSKNGSTYYNAFITKVIVEYVGEDSPDTPDDGSITIAKLLSGGKDVEAAKIRFTNAQVVYKEDNAGSYNYIVREDGKAIDLMNTSLSLDLGATLNGTVVMDVAYNGGIMQTTDIAETNSSDLTPTGSSIDYLPITTTLNNLSNNKGDLVMLEKVEIYDDTNGDFGLGSVHLLKSGYTYALISNYDEIADQITDANGQYFVTAWYNGVQGATPSVKVVAVQQALGAPVITAAEPTFTESTTVTITAADGATIYYTTDGTTPTVGGATTQVYTVPFTINKTTTVKAIAVKDGVSSDVSEKTFVGPKTIADIYETAATQENVLLYLNNAQVVYAKDNNYILREDGRALDISNTSLELKQGQFVTGPVKLNISYTYGIYSTWDVYGETTADKLTITGAESADPIPVLCATLGEVKNHPGDLVRVENQCWYGSYFYGYANNTYDYLRLSNASAFDMSAYKYYDVTVWYNQVYYGQPKGEAISVEPVITYLDSPFITGDEKFVESTTLTITHPEAVVTIKYTLDGTNPLNTTSTVYTYTKPLTLSESATVCAVATYKNVTSDIATKTFTKISLTDPLTIAELALLKTSIDNATVSLVNAQVVYTETTEGKHSYILREDGKALDILNSSLALTQGKTYAGNLKLKVTYIDGILTASDIEGETNADNLTSTGEESAEPLPIACDITQAKNYLGDLVTLSNVQLVLDATSGDRFNYYSWYDYTDYNVYISNAADFGLKNSRYYTATLWLDGVKVTDPLGKIIDAYPSQLDAPTINGEEAFASSVQVEIVSDEAVAEIYYTTDGTDPSKESTRYTAPFTITNSCTVKAIATYRNVVSSIAAKAFTKYDPYAEKTIADLADAKENVPMVTVRLENAKVVYGEGKSYILRENINGKDYALDVLSTELPLTVGATVSGTVMLKIGFKPNVGHNNGVLSTSDVAETNADNLTIVPGANTLPSPIVLDASNFSNVYNYPGDILDLSGVYGWNYVSFRQLWIGNVEVNLTNGEDYDISNNVVYNNVLIWYNDVYTDQTRPLAKIVGKKENYDYTLTAAGWGTIIIPFDCEKPEGLTIYECTSVNDGKLVVEEVNSFKANTPYLLKGPKDVETTYPLEGYAAKHGDKYEKGVMVGVYSWQEPPADSYVLQNQDEGLAFYRHLAGNGVEVGPNRCYIKPQSGELKSIQFPDDETNGVAYANATDSSLVDVYTTAGVKVKHQVKMGKALNDLPAGLYIINNKKIVKK